jgi:hypothetical protein
MVLRWFGVQQFEEQSMSIETAVEAVANVATAIEAMEMAMEGNDAEAFADAAAQLVVASSALSDEVITLGVEAGILEEAEESEESEDDETMEA